MLEMSNQFQTHFKLAKLNSVKILSHFWVDEFIKFLKVLFSVVFLLIAGKKIECLSFLTNIFDLQEKGN